MGQVVAKITEPLQQCGGSVRQILSSRKRRRSSVSNTSSDDQLEVPSPKKKKLLTTTQYIFQALFKEEKDSDITVYALDRIWKLHKIYLEQSPYFYSMFSGGWRESSQAYVRIKIPDARITQESLDRVFGALYCDEIEIDSSNVLSILATATLFQLDSIIDKCGEVMIENIKPDTAIIYYEAACEYGCLSVKKATFAWLEVNLLSVYSKNHKELRNISIELMTALVASTDLYVMQTEFSLYALMRVWIFLRLHPDFDFSLLPPLTAAASSVAVNETSSAQEQEQQTNGSTATLRKKASNDGSISDMVRSEVIQDYFAQRGHKSKPFLYTDDGREYMRTFVALRTQYLINHSMDMQIVCNDNIIPKQWLHQHCFNNWHSILKMDHMAEEGVKNLPDEVFLQHSMRCGRVLLHAGYQKWRWTGFNYGIDLILIADSRLLCIRRHHRNEHERLLSLQTKRDFMIRVSISSINQDRQVTFTQTTPILSLTLEKNEETNLMLMDHKLVHPLLLSVNWLIVKPELEFKQRLQDTEEFNCNSIPISDIGESVELTADTTQEEQGISLRNRRTAKTSSNSSSSSSSRLTAESSISSQNLELGFL